MPQVASVVQHLVKEGTNQAYNAIEASPGSFQVEKPRFRPEKEIVDTKANKPNSQASVKGKKAIACNRASLTTQSGATKGTKSTVLLFSSKGGSNFTSFLRFHPIRFSISFV